MKTQLEINVIPAILIVCLVIKVSCSLGYQYSKLSDFFQSQGKRENSTKEQHFLLKSVVNVLLFGDQVCIQLLAVSSSNILVRFVIYVVTDTISLS